MKKYFWFNPSEGKFGDVFTSEDSRIHEDVLKDYEMQQKAAKIGWYIIKYICVNKPDFEFTHHMKLS